MPTIYCKKLNGYYFNEIYNIFQDENHQHLNGDDYLQQGIDLLKSGEFEDAENYIKKAIKGGNKSIPSGSVLVLVEIGCQLTANSRHTRS